MQYQVKQENDFQFIEEGNGPVLLLLHGLFGALSNWVDVVDRFSKKLHGCYPVDADLHAAIIEYQCKSHCEICSRFHRVQEN